MSRERLAGAILAAGKGSRLIPISENYPKPLLPICNKPIVQYQMEYMKDLGIDEIFVVVGHLQEHFENTFGDGSRLGLKLHFLEQESQIGIAHAVSKLERHIHSPFILFLGDIFIIPNNLKKLLDIFYDKEAGAVLATKIDTPDNIKRNFAIRLDEDGRVIRVIEKPRYPPNNLKGCGIYLFDQAIFDAIRRTPRTAMRDEYEITESIQIFINDGYPVYCADVVRDDMNITFPKDLIMCNVHELHSRGLTSLIGNNVSMEDGVELVDTVIGDNCLIEGKPRFVNSLIFPGTKVKQQDLIENSIITPDYRLDFEDM